MKSFKMRDNLLINELNNFKAFTYIYSRRIQETFIFYLSFSPDEHQNDFQNSDYFVQ